MTIHRLIDDLQDAMRQAMADGPHGTGRRGVWVVERRHGAVWCYLLFRGDREKRGWVRFAFEDDGATVEDDWLRPQVMELCRMARVDGTDLELPGWVTYEIGVNTKGLTDAIARAKASLRWLATH